MKKNIWRLVTALIVSSAGFFGTVFWFEAGKPDEDHGDHQPVARLSDSTNEVQRKPVKRVIWESVNRNDELYPGEAVRTAPNADARLFFIKSGTVVRLEPDSLVVLEETDKGLSLDFLQGNLFVQSTGGASATDALTLKTGSGEIQLKSTDISLSKSQNGNVSLEVHRGEAQLTQAGKNTALSKDKTGVLTANGLSINNESLQLTKPQAGDTLYLNLQKAEKLELNWKPIASSYSVTVEIGPQRGAMISVPVGAVVGSSGHLSLLQKPGRWYLRLIATSADPKQPKLTSTTIPLLIEPKSEPLLVEPRLEAIIIKSSPTAETAFKWANRHKLESQILEVANNVQFKNAVVHETLASEVTTFARALPDGIYYWRVTGFLKVKDKNESLSSKPGKFTLNSKLEVKPPILISPINDTHLSVLDLQKNGLSLKWQASAGVANYKLNVETKVGETWKSVLDQEQDDVFAQLTDLKVGRFRWTVGSIDPKGGEHHSTSFNFIIDETQKLEWADRTLAQYEFHTPSPILQAQWKPLVPAPSMYRYRVAPEGKPLVDEAWHTTQQNALQLDLSREGSYQMIVEALNDKGQTLAVSEIKTVSFKRQPLLPAPQWAANTPPVFKTDSKGNLTLGWEQVQGAERYLMILESLEGKVIDQKEVSRTTASLSRLKPGQYQVHLKSVDDFKRPGLEGDRRKIEVPASNDIRAPKIKAIKVN